MGNCPVCSQSVADDFGLVECSKCGAQLIVHVDGTVEYSGTKDEAADLDAAAPESATPAPEPQEDFNFEATADDAPAEAYSEALAEAPAEAPETHAEPPPQESPEAPMYKMENQGNSPNLSDLAAFANSPESGGREGPFRYTVSISGIDTSDVRLAFREAITDRKFMWDTEQILRSIKQGQVVIANVSPGKAYILINRLRSLPVDVSWEQNAITQP